MIKKQRYCDNPKSYAYALSIYILYRIRHINALHIAFISGLSGGIFEYFCSVLQEKLLGTRFWDYSQMPFNIDGRTSLKFMIFWGVRNMCC